MNLHPRHSHIPVLIFALCVLGPVLRATPTDQSAPPATNAGETQLVVKDGFIFGRLRNGQPVPATLGEITELIMQRYPSITINVVGVGQLPVHDLKLRWPPADHRDDMPGAVMTLVRALADATGKVLLVDRSEFTFLVRPLLENPSNRRIEVFNLRLYLEGPGDPSDLDNTIRELQSAVALRQKELDSATSRATAGLASANEVDERKAQLEGLRNQLALVTQRLKRKHLSDKETNERIDQVLQVVNETLGKVSPDEKPPEYEYHAGTHLLIVIGSDTAIDVTRKVVNALQQGPN